MKKIFALFFATILSAPAYGQIEEALAGCAEIASDSVRLFCYDVLAGREALDGGSSDEQKSKQETRQNWLVERDVSRVDDSAIVFLSTPELGTARGSADNPASFLLVLACRENKTNIWVHFGSAYTFGKDNRMLTYRIDDKSARTKRFGESNKGEALGLWSGNSAIPFIKSLFGADRLFIRATPKSATRVEAEFDISGLEQAVEPLRKACHW